VDGVWSHGYLNSRAGIYAAPRILLAGQKFSPAELAAALRRGLRRERRRERSLERQLFCRRRGRRDPANNVGGYPAVVRITFDPAGRINQLTGDEISLDSLRWRPISDQRRGHEERSAQSTCFQRHSPVLVQAITSNRGSAFLDHMLDIFGVARALYATRRRSMGQGGSTITQQLIKNTYLSAGTNAAPQICRSNAGIHPRAAAVEEDISRSTATRFTWGNAV